MKKRNYKTDELDSIGRRLLDAGKTRREDIERIVSSPTLFAAVLTRIEIERRSRDSRSVFGGWTSVLILNRQRVTSAALLFFVLGAIGVIGINRFAARQQLDRTAVQETSPEIEPIKNPPVLPTDQTPENSLPMAKIKNLVAAATRKTIKQNVDAGKTTNAQKPARRRKFQPGREKTAGEFYALTSAGNPAENGEQLSVVRANLSPSSLFALGVNLSIENGSQKIKTDLLVGADGVARAIRFVD